MTGATGEGVRVGDGVNAGVGRGVWEGVGTWLGVDMIAEVVKVWPDVLVLSLVISQISPTAVLTPVSE